MSDTNGRLAPSANGTAKARLTANPTRRYTPSTTGMWWGYGSGVIDGKPFFTWMDVPRMVRDPNVRFAERMWRAPFHRVKWTVKAESPKVAQFVGTSLRRIWRRSLPKLLSRYFRYGYAPGGTEFVERKGLIRAERVRAVEPMDARPRVWTCGPNAGQAAGFTLGHGNAVTSALSGESWVGPEHAVWFAGMQEFGPFYDMPPMSGMFEPWLEKNTRGGAIQSRQVHARKCAGVGGMLRHPDGEVNMGTAESPRVMDGQDVARQMLDYMESWAHLTLPNEAHPGIPGKFAWEYTPPQVMPDAPHLREYVQQLDKEMLRGIGIPPEVLEASEVGSGWSGRMIPLTSFLAGVDELAGLLIECFDSPLRYAVQANFGAGTWYEVEPQSLAEEAQKQGKGDGKSGEGDNPIPGLLGLAGRDKSRDPTAKPTGGGLEMSDDRSPIAADIAAKARQLGHRRKRDLIQIVVLAMLKAQEQAARRGKPEGAGAYLDQLGELAQDPDRLAEITGAKSMSWTPYNGARGGHGWKNTETGRIIYSDTKPGEKREKAKASGQKAREILTKVTRQQATPDDLVELADHLPALPVARLRTARQLLGASWGGSKVRREGMVAALLEHVRGRVEHERTHGPAKVEDTRPERDAAVSKWKDAPPGMPDKPAKAPEAKPGGVQKMPTSHLHVDPARFQFKLNTGNAAGVTDELKQVHQWNPDFAGVTSVWKDPADSKTYVVNGHHRRELAGRLGVPDMDVRYIDAPDAKTARAKGALINIAEGRGTAVDAAKFMRDTGVTVEDFAKHGVPLKAGALADQATTLTRLNDKAFDRLAAGDLDMGKALAVAKHLPDVVRQEKLFKLLEKREDEGKDVSNRTMEEMARAMASAPSVTKTEDTLWGAEETTEDVFVQRAELAGHVRAELAKEMGDFAAVASQRRAGSVAGAGNVLNVDENQRRAKQAEQAKNLYDQLVNRKGPISDALNAGAVKLAGAKTKKERERARSETADAVRGAVQAEFDALNKTD